MDVAGRNAALKLQQSACDRHDGFTATERLRIYRNTYRSVLIETLRMTQPAVDREVKLDADGKPLRDTEGRFITSDKVLNVFVQQKGQGCGEA